MSDSKIILLENHEVRIFYLDEKTKWSFGRATASLMPDIPVGTNIVGRVHGEFVNHDGQWFYIDKGSINGTFYNGRHIKSTSETDPITIMLTPGDFLQVDNQERSHDSGIWMFYTTEAIGAEWKTFPLDRDLITVGRNEEKCDLVVPSIYISREHFKLIRSGATFYIEDRKSTTGTWVNGEQLNGKIPLRVKDCIRICDGVFIFTGEELLYSIGCDRIVEAEPVNTGSTPESTPIQKDIILRADIVSKKVPNNSGVGEKELLHEVHVEVKEGTLVALLGGSGAGKSTAMNCMNGMDTKGVTGQVYFKGVDLLKDFARMKSLIGSVPQEEVFHPMLTVESELMDAAMIRLPGDTTKKEVKAIVTKTMAQLNLTHIRKNKICKCSGGEKKRVNIAIELVADRQLLCLDEPDAGLDPGMKKELFTILNKLAHEQGKSILVIIHDVSDIDLFDQVIMLTKYNNVGRLAFSGSPAEAREYFGTEIKNAYQLLAESPEKYIKGGF